MKFRKEQKLTGGGSRWLAAMLQSENLSLPRRCCLYLLSNFISLAIQNDETRHLPPQDRKQLESFLRICGCLVAGRNQRPSSGAAKQMATLR